MSNYIHCFDFLSSIDWDDKDFKRIPLQDLRIAIKQNLDLLDDEGLEKAINWVSTSEEDMGSIKVIANWSTLMRLARRNSRARASYEKNPTTSNLRLMEEAKLEFDSYRKICLGADEMTIPQVE
jgi:hypothetical protein